MSDVDRVREQAGMTGEEPVEILRGREAARLLADPLLAQAFAELGAYYAAKQVAEGDDVAAVMRWQAQRVALADVETAFRGYIETGTMAEKRTSRFQRLVQALKKPPSRMSRFRTE